MHLDRLKAHQEKLQRHGKPQPHRVKDPVEHKPFDPYEDMWCSLVTLALSPRDPRSRCWQALEAIDKELGDLRVRGVWDEKNVKSSRKVLQENPKAHISKLFSIVGLKNYDAPPDKHIWKGRIVFGGHDIRQGPGKEKVTLFEQTASHPSSMCSARCAVAYGCLLPDGVTLQTDCDKAYTQSLFDGPETWVRLPKQWWPKGQGWENIEDPVCRLVYNLYGHPRAGNGWERYAESVCEKHGFEPVPEWPSVFWNPEHDVLLIIYVMIF